MEKLIRCIEKGDNRERLVKQFGEKDVLDAEDWARERKEYLMMRATGQIKHTF